MLYMYVGSFALGILCQSISGFYMLLPLLGLVSIYHHRDRWMHCVGILLTFYAAVVLGLFQIHAPQAQDAFWYSPLKAQVRGVVSSSPGYKKGRWGFGLKVTQVVQGKKIYPIKTQTWVSVKDKPSLPLAHGQFLQISGQFQIPQGQKNPGGFNYQSYLKRQGYATFFRGKDLIIINEAPVYDLLAQLGHFKRLLFAKMGALLTPEESAFLGSLVFGGQTQPLSEHTQNSFSALGLQHVLAVSGFQINLLIFLCLGLSKKAGLPRLWASVLSGGLIWVFIVMTGSSASVVRAGLTGTCALVAYASFKEVDFPKTLALSALLMLIYDTQMLYDIGFQFSFLATWGLLSTTDTLQSGFKWLPLPLAMALSATLSAQLWVLPAQLYYFGSFSPWFLPANLLAGLCVPALTYLTFALLPLLFVSQSLSVCLVWGLQWGMLFFFGGIAWINEFPGTLLQMKPFHWGWVYGAYGLLACLLWGKYQKQILLLTGSQCLLLAALPATCPTEIVYFATDSAPASLLSTAKHKVLIGLGSHLESYKRSAKYTLTPYLKRQGISTLDLVILLKPGRHQLKDIEDLHRETPIQSMYLGPKAPQILLSWAQRHDVKLVSSSNMGLSIQENRVSFKKGIHQLHWTVEQAEFKTETNTHHEIEWGEPSQKKQSQNKKWYPNAQGSLCACLNSQKAWLKTPYEKWAEF